MTSRPEINLTGVAWPVCLLQCNNELKRLTTGEEIDVRIQDREVLKDLLKILERSADHTVLTVREEDDYRLHIKKL